jgi:hypothetical protein
VPAVAHFFAAANNSGSVWAGDLTNRAPAPLTMKFVGADRDEIGIELMDGLKDSLPAIDCVGVKGMRRGTRSRFG